MTTAIHRQVEEARKGELPRVIARMKCGWAVLGATQITHGYALLLPDPVVPDLNALTGDARRQFLDDMARLGDAILEETQAERINYEILGNTDAYLHAHLFARYDWEPPERIGHPVWLYDRDEFYGPESALAPRHDELRARIAAELEVLTTDRGQQPPP